MDTPKRPSRPSSPSVEDPKPAKRARTDRQSDFSELLRSGRYSDLRLKCEGETFNVHKSVVCAQSPVLARAVDGKFQEATTGVIVIQEFPVNVVRQMVAFLYDGKYTTDVAQPQLSGTKLGAACTSSSDAGGAQAAEAGGSTGEGEANPRHLFHMRMNAIADYYDIESLRVASRDSLQLALEQDEDGTGSEILELVSTARESNGDKKLHGVLATAAIEHLPQLIEDGILAGHCKDEFEYQLIVACTEKMAENAEFREEWEDTVPATLRWFLKEFSRTGTLKCTACNKTYKLATDAFNLTRDQSSMNWRSQDEDDKGGPLTVRCSQCGHVFA